MSRPDRDELRSDVVDEAAVDEYVRRVFGVEPVHRSGLFGS
jgi:hypothetical protein